MKLLKPSPHRARNDFDLSHRHVFDANFGELLPATTIETVPGDNITLHASDLVRNIPFIGSPFLRAKQHLDVWFVPYHDLWHQFDAFITKRREPVSSAFQGADFLPHADVYTLKSDINAIVTAGLNCTDVAGRNIDVRGFYLLQLLGYGDLSGSVASSGSLKVNLFNLAAYNYIWYNEYRQQYYDDGTRIIGSNANPAKLFNFDDLSCDSEANADITADSSHVARVAAMCQMRYRCWKKDLFTGLLPSTQFGAVSTVNVFSNSLNVRVRLTDSNNQIIENSGDFSNIYSASAGGVNVKYDDSGVTKTGYLKAQGDNSFVNSSFDVLALRKSEAIQIWRENALRAGNHIKDNMMAHYGVASDFNDHRPTYLGSVDAPLNITDVMTTANGNSGWNDDVGDIAGKGISSLNEKVFKFHAKDFGVIMVMFSMLPEAEYEGIGIERNNQLLEAEDFFMPEFENLGLEAVSSANIHGGSGYAASSNFVLGYAPRYFGYKTKLDRAFGQFIGLGTWRPWTSPREDITAYLNTFSTFSGVLPQTLLYVNPALFNDNFQVYLSISNQFMVDLYFDVDAVRPMSVVGLPFS